MLFHGLLGGFAFTSNADTKHHFRGDREQQQAAGNAERGERNSERAEEPIKLNRREWRPQ